MVKVHRFINCIWHRCRRYGHGRFRRTIVSMQILRSILIFFETLIMSPTSSIFIIVLSLSALCALRSQVSSRCTHQTRKDMQEGRFLSKIAPKLREAIKANVFQPYKFSNSFYFSGVPVQAQRVQGGVRGGSS